MEFDEVPENTAETLARLRAVQSDIAAALAAIMVGLVDVTHLMEPIPSAAARRRNTFNFFYFAYSIHSRFRNMLLRPTNADRSTAGDIDPDQ